MKKTILLMCLFGIVYGTASAQLKVVSNGNVAIGTSSTPLSKLAINGVGSSYYKAFVLGNSFGLYAERTGTSTWYNWGFGAFARSNNANDLFSVGIKACALMPNNTGTSTGRSFGVFAQAGYATSGYNYAVHADLMGTGNGTALYASNVHDDAGIVMPARYAGYFRGGVYMDGTLTVTGGINGVLLLKGVSGSNTNTGASLRGNSDTDDAERLEGLSLLSYYREMPDRSANLTRGDTVETLPELNPIELQSIAKKHYALDVEQLEQLFPDLVYENEDGTKGVNYMEMIPLLVKAVGDLQAEIAEMKSFDNAKSKARSATGINTADGQVLSLGQNNPNPFSESTSIEVCVPDEIVTAALIVYDMSGAQVEKIDITKRGTTRVSFSGTGLKEGMYLYSLVADGKVVGTKKMVLTK